MYEEIKKILATENIPYSYPSAGCFKINAPKLTTLMFYPKSGKLIWTRNKKDFQHKYVNDDLSLILIKIKSLI